jgi:hypothetical protein
VVTLCIGVSVVCVFVVRCIGPGISCTVCCVLYCVLFICCTVSIDVFPLDTGMVDRGPYSEGPATSHLDTGLSFFPHVFKQMLSLCPRPHVAPTCFSCSPPDVNLVAKQLHVLYVC